MWAFPVVTWAFPVATGNAHITHVPTGNAHVTTGMRLGMPTHTIYGRHASVVWAFPQAIGNDHDFYLCWGWERPRLPFMLGMGMTITSIYGKAMVVPSWGGNDHPYYVWKVWSFPFLQLGMTILAIYGSGVVLPIPSVGNGHYCHIWKVWKAWVAQLELLSVELVNLSQQSSWLLDYPLDPAVQQKWSPFAREYAGGAMDCSLIPPSGCASKDLALSRSSRFHADCIVSPVASYVVVGNKWLKVAEAVTRHM
ncbi:hypothetical protein B0H14DRAFT_2592027 [Mycena olivaceomarginata]|nr:hypothetical protein B0H14DRAFT_2592027 [Mycena olivaceomarginata]